MVTGAARGLGRAIALRLSSEGAAVAIHHRRNTVLAESLALQIRGKDRLASLVRADVRDPSQVKSMVAQVNKELGPIDILVNNAMAFFPGELVDLKDSEIEDMWRTNVCGPVYITQLVAEGMKVQRFGRIINISSAAAFGTAVQGTTFYAATKAALLALTRRFAMDLGPHGITVNAVSPGFIPTQQAMGERVGDTAQAYIDFFANRTMLRRVGTPEEIASAVAFLASPEAGFITAQTLSLDGGRLDYLSHS